jgi:hypothetical protein
MCLPIKANKLFGKYFIFIGKSFSTEMMKSNITIMKIKPNGKQ